MRPTTLLISQIALSLAIFAFGTWFATQCTAGSLGYQQRSPSSSPLRAQIAAKVGVVRRLDRLDQRLDHIERDQTILIEAFALFLRHHFSITPPIPDAHQDAARAQGSAL